jgi:hypothetical protein
VLGIVLAPVLPSGFTACACLLLFGVGSVVAMGLFSSVVGRVAGARGATSLATQSALLVVCSVLAVAVGGFWLFSAFTFAPRVGALI